MENVKLAIIYYSSTGTNYQLAQWAEKAAKKNGVKEVKLLKVQETASKEVIAEKKDWQAHVEATKDVPVVSLEDLEWADCLIFSAPTRYGDLLSQLSAFLMLPGDCGSKGNLPTKW